MSPRLDSLQTMLQESPTFDVEWTSTYIFLEGLVKDVSEMHIHTHTFFIASRSCAPSHHSIMFFTCACALAHTIPFFIVAREYFSIA